MVAPVYYTTTAIAKYDGKFFGKEYRLLWDENLLASLITYYCNTEAASAHKSLK